jgi:hypothetical protein
VPQPPLLQEQEGVTRIFAVRVATVDFVVIGARRGPPANPSL